MRRRSGAIGQVGRRSEISNYLRSALQPMTTSISLGLGGSRVVDEIDALSVRRHVVLRSPVPRSDERHVQRDSWTERQLSSRSASHRSATKMAFTIDVEQLLPVAAPDGLAAAVVGDHETPWWPGHRTNGHFRSASLLRDVRQPLSVGRYPRVISGNDPERIASAEPPSSTGTRHTSPGRTPNTVGRVLTMRSRPSGDQSVGSQ